jgi:hypothetical protein
MLIRTPVKTEKRHRRQPRGTSSRAVVPLTLASAAYDADRWTLTLAFGRAIEIGALDVEQVTVLDGAVNGMAFRGTGDPGPQLLTPTTVEVALIDIGEFTGGGVRMTATAATGIVADDDGGTWAGVTDLALPFG